MKDYIGIAAQYQADVLSGVIPACKWVRLSCARNRKDLDRQETAAFPYRFDPDAGRRICQMAEMLPHIKGPKAFVIGKDDEGRAIWNPIRLEPWQCWLLSTIFGWVRVADGRRRFRIAFPLIPRKNAKSTLAAIAALYMLVADGESGAEVYSAATTRDQAKVIAEIAWEMARRSPSFRDYFGVKMGSKTTRTLSVPEHASTFSPLSADASSLDGLNVSFAAIDEFHAHKTRGVFDVLDTATGTRLQPLLFPITTAGVELGGICHEKLQYLEKVLDGVVVDETFWGCNWTIDSQPHIDKMELVHALQELGNVCQCGRVLTTQIERCFREACARHATTAGIGRLAPNDVKSIRAEKSKRGECAHPVIGNGGSSEILNSENVIGSVTPRRVVIGQLDTDPDATLRMRDTEQTQKQGHGSKKSDDSTRTESPLNSTIDCTPINAASARSASEAANLYTWITATARTLFADSFARNATARSVFSETLRTAYDAHSPTCSVRKKIRLLDDGWIEVDRPGDDIRDPVIQRKANPNYGVSVQPDDLERKILEAQQSPAALNNVLTKHFNVWIRTESSWMTATTWQTCSRPGLTIEDLKQYPCWIGVDLAEVRDIAALVALFKTGPETYAMIGRFYLPEAAVDKSPIAQMSGWVREPTANPWLNKTDGDQADFARIQADILAWCDVLKVKEIDFDRALAAHMQQDLKRLLEPRMGRDAVDRLVVTVPQRVEEMNPAMQMVERLVLAKKLQHDGNPVMAWMISNIVIERNYKDEIYPRKAGGKDSANKIDGPVALFTCLSQAMKEQATAPSFQMLFVGRTK